MGRDLRHQNPLGLSHLNWAKPNSITTVPPCCGGYSVAESCLTLYDPTDCSTPGFPVHHQLPELAQTHVHPVSDAIQPSHPLSSCSPPASVLSSIRVFSSNQFFASGGRSIGGSASAPVLPMNIQGWFPFELSLNLCGQRYARRATVLSALCRRDHVIRFTIRTEDTITNPVRITLLAFLKGFFIFNWRIIALQCYVCFWHTSTGINLRALPS